MVKRVYSCCCCSLKFDIPAGLTTLEEYCGKSTGIMRPGAHWCYCCCRRVACMVTKAIVNYNAPVSYILLNYFSGRLQIAPPKIMLISLSISISLSECQAKR